MKLEFEVPNGMAEMITNVVRVMCNSYYKAKGKSQTAEGRLPIPTQEEVITYVVNNGFRLRFDALAFFKAMDNKKWQDKDGKAIYNWQKLINYYVEHGDYAGVTDDPNAPPPELPTTVRKETPT